MMSHTKSYCDRTTGPKPCGQFPPMAITPHTTPSPKNWICPGRNCPWQNCPRRKLLGNPREGGTVWKPGLTVILVNESCFIYIKVGNMSKWVDIPSYPGINFVHVCNHGFESFQGGNILSLA